MSYNSYNTAEQISDLNIKYYFISQGHKNIVKAVEYTFVDFLQEKRIFNLAFGDYLIHENTIDDMSHSNNGDGRKVFRTVLDTIPLFFNHYKSDIVMITGSDSKPEYLALCLLECKKKCGVADECRNKDQRINVYSTFVSANFSELEATYTFFGGVKNNNGIGIVPYTINNKYDAIFVIKK